MRRASTSPPPAAAASSPNVATDAPREHEKKPRSRSQHPHRQPRKRQRQQQPLPSSLFSRLMVRSDSNKVHDPRELQTILLFSLRNLWGDLESHSGHVQVTKRPTDQEEEEEEEEDSHSSHGADASTLFEVTCLTESVDAVRAALTMVTPPPYLQEGVGESVSLFRFDVLDVHQPSSNNHRNG